MQNRWLPGRRLRHLLKLSSFVVTAVLILVTIPNLPAQVETFNPRTVIDHSFPPIVTPKTLSVSDAEAADRVRDDELVLGVVVDGEARAYPINTLTGAQREIINDELGGRSIAATW